MPASRPASFAWHLFIQSLRFCYLLWGGMLLGALAYYNRVRPPDFLWFWPAFARFLMGRWGRGLLLGLSLAMLISALLEVWELVDRILTHFMHDHERES